eukprot:3951565-Prymnesium_polylepis.1
MALYEEHVAASQRRAAVELKLRRICSPPPLHIDLQGLEQALAEGRAAGCNAELLLEATASRGRALHMLRRQFLAAAALAAAANPLEWSRDWADGGGDAAAIEEARTHHHGLHPPEKAALAIDVAELRHAVGAAREAQVDNMSLHRAEELLHKTAG